MICDAAGAILLGVLFTVCIQYAILITECGKAENLRYGNKKERDFYG